MLLIRSLFSFIIIFFLFNTQYIHPKIIKYAVVKYKKLRVRENPSRRAKILFLLKSGEKVQIIDKKGVYYKIFSQNGNIQGWAYYKGFYKIKKIVLPDYKVNFEFNAINKETEKKILEFKRFLNFDFYKKDIKIIFSYEKKYNTGRIFIEADFNPKYYIQKKILH